jgi:hypothetical protein
MMSLARGMDGACTTAQNRLLKIYCSQTIACAGLARDYSWQA